MDKRIKYWEKNYVEYWKDRVSDNSKNNLAKKDVLPPDLKIFKKYYKKALSYINKNSPTILDIGIGFGRFAPLYKENFESNIWGSDISQGMVDECKKNYPEISKQIKTAPAETQPFKDASMDLIICWATFDATFQDKTLWEFQRLLKIGGLALITGKNDKYLATDKKALTAEINARKKGHPNYFTDINFLEQHIKDFGFEIVKLFKFKRRGDFANDLSTNESSRKFYEYILILRKTAQGKNKHKIASKFSKVYKQIDKTIGE
ncbi:MAG: class I SAM-dependent methyltransferase [Microgenomates group bacterium]